MKITKKITVTKGDIERGKPSSTSNCPIAKAIKRVLKKSNISVGPGSVVYGNRYGLIPERVTDFICEFDAGIKVRPFNFNLTLE